EGRPFPAELLEKRLHPPRQVALGATHEALLGEALEGGARDRGRAPDRVQLLVVLDDAKRLDDPRPRDEVDAGRRQQRIPLVAEGPRLERDAALEQLRELGVDVAARLNELDTRQSFRPL